MGAETRWYGGHIANAPHPPNILPDCLVSLCIKMAMTLVANRHYCHGSYHVWHWIAFLCWSAVKKLLTHYCQCHGSSARPPPHKSVAMVPTGQSSPPHTIAAACRHISPPAMKTPATFRILNVPCCHKKLSSFVTTHREVNYVWSPLVNNSDSTCRGKTLIDVDSVSHNKLVIKLQAYVEYFWPRFDGLYASMWVLNWHLRPKRVFTVSL